MSIPIPVSIRSGNKILMEITPKDGDEARYFENEWRSKKAEEIFT